MQAKDINQIVQQILAALPPGFENFPKSLHQYLRDAINVALNKCDFVSREEFDAQAGVLQKTRANLEGLEKKMQELEESLK
jgi:ubiquinone biosynthesis accessory factor UbiK